LRALSSKLWQICRKGSVTNLSNKALAEFTETKTKQRHDLPLNVPSAEYDEPIAISKRVASETIGTGMLLTAIVGSGIMAERLANGNAAIALLANTIATGAALIALILAFGPISGAHLNPVVTLAGATRGDLPWRDVPSYLVAQVCGAVGGVIAAHLMFGLPMLSLSTHIRSGPAQMFSEFIATFGLLAVIWGCSRKHASAVAYAVGAYITGAYWFTGSTSFANPAVTMARSLSNSFSGIRPHDAPGFIAAQLAGGVAATLLFRWLIPANPRLTILSASNETLNLREK
jgi:glycerol uptake facilitator-like aquaporin